MKKIVLMILVIVFSLQHSLLSQDYARLAIDQYKVQGNFKSCSVYCYSFKSGKLNLESIVLYETFIFDNRGNTIKYLCNGLDSTRFDSQECEYDLNGNLIRSITFDQTGSIIFKEECDYNKSGKLIKRINYDKNSIIYQEINSLDKNDSIFETLEFDAQGLISQKYEYSYCENKLFQKHRFGYDNKLMSIEKNYYDNSGNIILKENVNPDSSFRSKFKYKRNHIIEQIDYRSDGTINSKQINKYDIRGNKIEEILYSSYDSNLKLISQKKYKYNKLRKTTETLIFNDDGTLRQKTRIKYDRFANINEVVYYQSNIPVTKLVYIYSK